VRNAVLTSVVVVFAAAFLVRTVLVRTIGRRRPRLTAAVDRWWPWTPVVVVLVVLTVANPVVGVLTAVLAWYLLTRGSSIGSPFRPRR
jgi:hypothetical protein